LAGFPPPGGFIAKTLPLLFGAALGAGWIWLAVVMVANVALSLYHYLRVIRTLYLRAPSEQASVDSTTTPNAWRTLRRSTVCGDWRADGGGAGQWHLS